MKDSKNDLVGMVASHIDDFLHVGDPEFDNLVMDKMRERFLAGKLEVSQFKPLHVADFSAHLSQAT